MSEIKNIHQRIVAVMSQCDYLQKQKAEKGVGILYDEVIAMLRALLIEHGIVTVMRQKSMECIGGVGQNQKIYQGEYEMDLVNADDPKDLVTHTCFAHGMDGGDKGPGKAHTYAAKQMLVKAFNIETGINEESRAERLEKLKTIDSDEQDELVDLIDGDAILWKAIANAYNITHLNMLPKSKMDEVKTRIKNYKEKTNGNN